MDIFGDRPEDRIPRTFVATRSQFTLFDQDKPSPTISPPFMDSTLHPMATEKQRDECNGFGLGLGFGVGLVLGFGFGFGLVAKK